LVALQRQRRLHAALACLSAADRSLLSSSYIDELDLAAIAASRAVRSAPPRCACIARASV
jgi:hypothetical protein